MNTLSVHFREFLKNINPPDDRVKLAVGIPPQVRKFLEEVKKLNTIDPHTRLGGSYARDTAVGDIKDVDVFVLLVKAYADEKPGEVLRFLADVLKGLPKALGSEGRIDIQPSQRRSVHVYFEDKDFHLDVVPLVAVDGTYKPLLVPDRELGKWIKTDPLGYQEALSSLNAEHEEKVVPLIKMHKEWRDFQMKVRRPKSYWLECLIYAEVNNARVTTTRLSYAELYRKLLDSIYDRFLGALEASARVPAIYDPQLGSNVASGWQRDEFEAYMNRIDESRKWAGEALEADAKKAIALWRRIFGDAFPESISEEAEKMATAALASGLYVSSRGIVETMERRLPSATITIPKHEFYGGED
jgi:hypothetical protein